LKQPAPGVVIADKYRLEKPLASGGMGSVWVAHHLQLEVAVAIKFIGAELASSAENRLRFEREAKAAALLKSPYVVNVQDYGVDGDLPYIVMELLHGEDLEDRLRRRKRLSPHETMPILAQAAKALGRAHERGIVHRDLKPRNLFIATAHDEEVVKILDFGIAKQINAFSVAGATTSHQIMGSPHYMSPEQIRGARDIDPRSDLWSLGVILFQTITGALPFPGTILIDVLNRVISGPIPQATQLVPDLPTSVDAFFVRALSRDKAKRFQSAREMVAAFAEAIGADTTTTRQSHPSLHDTPQIVPAVTPARLLQSTEPMPGPGSSSAPFSSTLLARPPQTGDLVTETFPRSAVLDTPATSRRSGVPEKRVLIAIASVLLAAGAAFGVVMKIGAPRSGAGTGAASETGASPLAGDMQAYPSPTPEPTVAPQPPAILAPSTHTQPAATSASNTPSLSETAVAPPVSSAAQPIATASADTTAKGAQGGAQPTKTGPKPRNPAPAGTDSPEKWGF
jgi:serine/threonine-protein kinase